MIDTGSILIECLKTMSNNHMTKHLMHNPNYSILLFYIMKDGQRKSKKINHSRIKLINWNKLFGET